MSWVEALGYAASVTVIATFCMSTMIPLRIAALVSNVLFFSYGVIDHLYPVLILHAVLFPVNLLRLVQFHQEDLPIQSLLPYMTKRCLSTGEIVTRKGEKADRLYYLQDGELEITDLAKTLLPGTFLGEIGVFARDQERTATIVCRTNCSLYELSESKAKQLFFQDKSFGFAVMQLIINRLLENNKRLLQAGAA